MIGDAFNLKRVCILALDALEYNLVEEFDLREIKQVEYGKIDLAMFKVVVTPLIWASFITGQSPEKHGINLDPVSRWRNPVIQRLRQLSIKLKLNEAKGMSICAHLLKMSGFREIPWDERFVEDFRDRKVKTIFDMVPNAVALSVPPYQRWMDPETRLTMKQALENIGQMSHYENRVWRVFEEKKRKYLSLLRETEWNLFMAHFMFTDLLGHAFAGNLTKMFKVYAEAEKLAGQVRKIVGKESLLLIVSDHGMKPIRNGILGDHSDHGFYSSNTELGLRKPRMTDFFDVIIKILSAK